MRVALLIYGHMRTYKKCIDSLNRNLISSLKPDVFIHTWSLMESRTPSWHSKHISVDIETNLEDINDAYRPVDIKIETQSKYTPGEDKRVDGISLLGFKYMYHSLNEANKLKLNNEHKNNFKYDIVIKIRPDIKLKHILTVDKFKSISNNTILVGSNGTRAVDIINIGTSDVINTLCKIHNQIDRYFGVPGENGFVKYLNDCSIQIVNINYNYHKQWNIVRDT